MNSLARIALTAAVALIGNEAFAAVCETKDSPASCLQALLKHVEGVEPSREALADTLEKDDADTLAKINTGQTSATSVQPTSAFNDFFSLLNVAAQGEQAGDESDEQAFGFDLNTCGVSVHRSLQCQIKGRIGSAEIYEPLIEALPEASRSSSKEELEESLDASDNVTAGFFLNLVTERLGRVPDFSDGGVFAAMRARAFNETNDERTKSSKAAKEWLEFLEGLSDQKCAGDENTEECQALVTQLEDNTTQFNQMPDGANGVIALSIYERTTVERLQGVVSMQRRLQGYGYFDLIQLVNNQPQLNFGIQLTSHGDLAGPDELRAKVSYEMGTQNMNALMDRCSDRTVLASCAQQFLADPEVRAGLQNADRIAVTLEYVRQKHYVINLPEYEASLDLPSQKSWIGSIVWGRYLTVTSADGRGTRFDLVGSYEDVSSDPLRQDRGVATLTLSQRLAHGFIATFAVVYATKPEFRGDVSEEWGSHLGVNYKFGRDPD